MYNPYQLYMNNQQIIRVSGEQGCRNYQMMPNSSCLMLDDSAPRIFLVQTDAMCYKTISAYKLEPYVEEPTPDFNSLADRISKLEEQINAKSNTATSKRKQKSTEPADGSEDFTD